MNVSDPEEEQPIAWVAIRADTPVYASDGQQVGSVSEVLGAEDEDIFHGIAVTHGTLRTETLIPADKVVSITTRRVETSLDSEEIRALPPYEQEASYKLGFTGFLSRHLGWVEDRRDAP